MSQITPAEAMALSEADFVATFGFLFEHSPWIVQRAARRRPFANMHSDLMQVVHDATPEERLDLIRAHPELAGKAAVAGELTAESTAEQASAGLDRLTRDEYDRFHALNAAYGQRFGFPFVICVRLTDKAGILAAMERRLANDGPTEMAAAIAEIEKIVKIRLDEVLCT